MFYTYLWLREDGTPYYVGKGSVIRAFTSWTHGVHKPVAKCRILVQFWESEEKAFEMENGGLLSMEEKTLEQES